MTNLIPRLRPVLKAAWLWLLGGKTIPAEVRALLAFEPGEFVLAVGRDEAYDPVLVATDRALHLCGEDGWPRLGWERLAAVRWDEASGRLVVTCLPGTTPRRMVVALPRPGTVPELADERITHTRLGRWSVPLEGDRVQIEARRKPGTEELLWHITPNGRGLNLDDNDLRTKVEEAIAGLVLATGITG